MKLESKARKQAYYFLIELGIEIVQHLGARPIGSNGAQVGIHYTSVLPVSIYLSR